MRVYFFFRSCCFFRRRGVEHFKDGLGWDGMGTGIYQQGFVLRSVAQVAGLRGWK